MQYFKRFIANEFEVWINLSNVFYCSSIKKGTERTYPTLMYLSLTRAESDNAGLCKFMAYCQSCILGCMLKI